MNETLSPEDRIIELSADNLALRKRVAVLQEQIIECHELIAALEGQLADLREHTPVARRNGKRTLN